MTAIAFTIFFSLKQVTRSSSHSIGGKYTWAAIPGNKDFMTSFHHSFCASLRYQIQSSHFPYKSSVCVSACVYYFSSLRDPLASISLRSAAYSPSRSLFLSLGNLPSLKIKEGEVNTVPWFYMILDKYLLPHASSKPSIQFFLTQTIYPLPVPTECLGWIAQLGKLNLNLLKNRLRRVIKYKGLHLFGFPC